MLTPDDRYAASAELHERWAECQLLALGVEMAAPKEAHDYAGKVGLQGFHFGEDDLLVIHSAGQVKHMKGLLTGDVFHDQAEILKLARVVLRQDGHWDDSDRRQFVSGSRWSDEKLVALTCLFPRGVSALRHQFGELLKVYDRIQRVRRLDSALNAALAGEAA